MILDIAPMSHAWVLADDFLSLEHWREYGDTTREYGVRTDLSVAGGNTLWIGGKGDLRLARDTNITPGEPAVFTLWVLADDQGRSPTSVRISDGVSVVNIITSGTPGLTPGWNRLVSRVTPPASWSHVEIRLYITVDRTGGGLGRLRAMPETQEADQ